MTESHNPAHPIAGTASGQPASMSVLLEDGEVEILAPPFFRMNEESALLLAGLILEYYKPSRKASDLYGWWRADSAGLQWVAPLDAWNPDAEKDDLK